MPGKFLGREFLRWDLRNILPSFHYLLGLWGLAGTAAPVGWWSWIARVFPGDAEAGGGLFVAVVQLSIALGSTLGGLLFDHSGYRSTFIMSAVLLASCAALAAMTARGAAARA